jgi:pyruvyltransferase
MIPDRHRGDVNEGGSLLTRSDCWGHFRERPQQLDTIKVMADIVSWNAERPRPWLRFAPRRVSRRFLKPVFNFGDQLGPLIVSLMLERMGIRACSSPRQRLLTVGSIMHLAQPGDVVWGSGRNGRDPDSAHSTDGLDIRAVRGPRTREWLLGRGVNCPPVFGDPALLLPMLRPDLVTLSKRKLHKVTFVSHIDDLLVPKLRGMHYFSPSGDVEEILRGLVQSELVVATSMHPVIVAEAFGVPARSIVNTSEPEFKFADYFLSTGRPNYARALSIAEALILGGERAPEIDLEPLVDAFPYGLFANAESSSTNG